MPTMRDMAPFVLSQRLREIVDHRPEIRPRSQAVFEALDEGLSVPSGIHDRVPLGMSFDQSRLLGLPTFFERDQVLDPSDRVTQGPVGPIDERGGLEGPGLSRDVRPLVKVGVMET